MLLVALLGLGFGFIGSIPVAGPISALVLSRGLQGRFKAGLFIALGGALIEGAYAALAFWGFSTFLAQYPLLTPISRGVGAVVMAALGITFLRKKPDDTVAPEEYRDSKRSSFFLGAWICAINPTLIASWSAVVTTIHGSGLVVLESSHAAPFAVGIAVGIAAWFGAMLLLIRRYRERFSAATLAKVVRGVGVLLLGLAVWFAVHFVRYFTTDSSAQVAPKVAIRSSRAFPPPQRSS